MPKKADTIIKLYRELMSGVTLEEVKLPTITDGDEYKKFCSYCDSVYSNPYFDLIKKQLLLAQVSKTAIDSKSYDEVQFGRAVINGLSLVDEIFGKYSREFNEKFNQNKEDFDSNRGFSSVS